MISVDKAPQHQIRISQKVWHKFGVGSKVANYFPIRFEFVNKISFFASKGHVGAPVFWSSYARLPAAADASPI